MVDFIAKPVKKQEPKQKRKNAARRPYATACPALMKGCQRMLRWRTVLPSRAPLTSPVFNAVSLGVSHVRQCIAGREKKRKRKTAIRQRRGRLVRGKGNWSRNPDCESPRPTQKSTPRPLRDSVYSSSRSDPRCLAPSGQVRLR